MKYDIALVALANVSTIVTVDADNEEQARQKAIQYAKDGNATWNYDGLSSDKTIEVGE